MNAIVPDCFELDPIEIDPRSCELCGCTIDRHERIDGDEGPLFFCLPPDEMDLDELERRAELIRQVEVAAIFARLEAMDDPSKRLPPPREPDPYRTPEATVNAFWFVVGLDDPDRLKAWFANHTRDVPALLKLLENKRC
jgi:hypothetical protein